MFLKAAGIILAGAAGYYYLTKKPGIKGVKPLTWYEYFRDLINLPTTENCVELMEKRGELYRLNFLFSEFLGCGGHGAIDFMAEQERIGKRVMSTTNGELHTKLRKLNSVSFRPGTLNSYVPKIERLVKELMFKQINTTDSFDTVTRTIITSIVFECLFGVQEVMDPSFQKTLNSWNQSFQGFTDGLFSLPINLPGFAYYRALKSREALIQQLVPFLKKQKEIYEASGRNPELKTTFITLMETPLDENGEFLTDYEMGEQAVLLYFARHDTTASFLTNVFKKLHDHPDAFQKARQEQLKLFPVDRPITPQDLSQMNYLEGCIKETLRLEAIVTTVFKPTTEDIMYKDIFIPKGTSLTFNLAGTNYKYNEHIAPPNQFEPNRFMVPTQDTFIPFGMGRHMCIGKNLFMMEAKMILSLFLRNYDWKQVGESTKKLFPVNTTTNLNFEFTRLK